MAPRRIAGNCRSSSTTLSGRASFVRRQGFLRAEITFAAEVVVSEVEFEGELFGGDFQDFDGFARHFRPGAVAADDCDVVAFHESVPPTGGSGDANGSAGPGNGILRNRLPDVEAEKAKPPVARHWLESKAVWHWNWVLRSSLGFGAWVLEFGDRVGSDGASVRRETMSAGKVWAARQYPGCMFALTIRGATRVSSLPALS